MKLLHLRRPATCAACRTPLEAGTQAGWDATHKAVTCTACLDAAGPSASPAGASAQREHDRRTQRREDDVRAAHPRIGGLLLALNPEPASTRVWAQGAAGERAVAAKLDELSREHCLVLHDRSLRRPDGRVSKANVDHLVVARSGVWVVDAKTHQGELEVRRSGGLLSPRVERLFINGRDQTKLVEGVVRQMHVVRAALGDDPVPIQGALCFVGTELPWFGSSSLSGVPLVGRRGLAKLVTADGPWTAEDRQRLHAVLARAFPAATG